jgi:AcrR family transcriptional regulator
MGRRSSFNDQDVFAAVGRRMVTAGELRLQAVVADTGVSVGSLYHRFQSREGLLAAAWLDALKAFQAEFAAALEQAGALPGLEAALATPRFCRTAPDRARLLVCVRRSEILSETTPAEFRASIAQANADTAARMQGFCECHGVPEETARLALIGLPLGGVRLYLPDRPVPASLDADIERAFAALIGPYCDGPAAAN